MIQRRNRNYDSGQIGGNNDYWSMIKPIATKVASAVATKLASKATEKAVDYITATPKKENKGNEIRKYLTAQTSPSQPSSLTASDFPSYPHSSQQNSSQQATS